MTAEILPFTDYERIARDRNAEQQKQAEENEKARERVLSVEDFRCYMPMPTPSFTFRLVTSGQPAASTLASTDGKVRTR